MCLNHVGGHHFRETWPRSSPSNLVGAFEPKASRTAGEPSIKELLEQLLLFLFGTSTVPVPCKVLQNVKSVVKYRTSPLRYMYSPGPEGTSCVNYWHTKLLTEIEYFSWGQVTVWSGLQLHDATPPPPPASNALVIYKYDSFEPTFHIDISTALWYVILY